MRIMAYYPNYFRDFGIAHASYNILRYMQSEQCEVHLFGLSSDPIFSDSFYTDLIPKVCKSLIYKSLSEKKISQLGEFLFLLRLKPTDIAYLWPGISLATYQKVKKRGCKIIYEGVNTHEANSKAILDAEYHQLGLPITHGVSEDKVLDESAKLELADYIYSCSPIMTKSYLDNNIPQSKILQTSYGFSADYLLNSAYVASLQPTFIFVGSVDVRKGVHLLLNYWVKANIDAKLKLVGKIDDAIKPLVSQYLNKYNIEHIPFTSDLPSIYRNADVFVLPSLEEGSPLVTYLAFAASLPCLVSPMGAGGVVADGIDGIVVDSHDAEKWIEALQTMACNVELRKILSVNARNKANLYTWDKVGKQRLTALINAEKNK